MRMPLWLAANMVGVCMLAAPALAGFKLMPAGQREQVGKSAMWVVPDRPWNRLGARLGRNAESWTFDGVSLNDLTFYTGIAANETLFKDRRKKDQPLPHFSPTMLVPDVVQLFESSYRIANNTSLFEIGTIEPAMFGGHDGFHFTYGFTIKDEEVRRNGEAFGAIIDGKLYMISFEAPVLHYFDRDVDAFRKLVGTATVGGAAARP